MRPAIRAAMLPMGRLRLGGAIGETALEAVARSRMRELGGSVAVRDPLIVLAPVVVAPNGASLTLETGGDTRPESVSRFRRCRSEGLSEACWKRRVRSFSRALLMMSSRLG